MEELNIEPVWNVAYHCQFNDAVEVSQILSMYHQFHIEILGTAQRKVPSDFASKNAAEP